MTNTYYNRAEVILEARCIYNTDSGKVELYLINDNKNTNDRINDSKKKFKELNKLILQYYFWREGT